MNNSLNTDLIGLNDIDPEETREWMEALEAVIEKEGSDRASYLIENWSTQPDKRDWISLSAPIPPTSTLSPLISKPNTLETPTLSALCGLMCVGTP